MSNIMAIILQSLCARLAVGSGRDLAQACRDFALAECDRARAEGRHADAWGYGLRAGWQRHRGVDLDDVLGRMLWAAEALHAPAWTALARHHLRAWTRG